MSLWPSGLSILAFLTCFTLVSSARGGERSSMPCPFALDDGGQPVEPSSKPVKVKWTIGFWINGDKGLWTYSKKALVQLEKLGASPDVSVVVDAHRTEQVSPNGPYDGLYEVIKRLTPQPEPKYSLDASQSEREALLAKEMEPKEAFSPTCLPKLPPNATDGVSANGVEDATDIAAFVAFMKVAYPAEHTALIFSTHGGAFRAGAGNGGAPDDIGGYRAILGTNQRPVMNWDLEKVLSVGMAKWTLSPQTDLIGFDSCLMASIEVAYSFNKLARVLVVSENLTEREGWDYAHIVQTVRTKPSIKPLELGAEIRRTFAQQTERAWNAAPVRDPLSLGWPARISVIDLTQVGATSGAGLAAKVNELGADLTNERQNDHDGSFAKLLRKVDGVRDECFVLGYKAADGFHGGAIDLRCMCQSLKDVLKQGEPLFALPPAVGASLEVCKAMDLAEPAPFNELESGWDCALPKSPCDRGLSIYYPQEEDKDIDGYTDPLPERGRRPSFVADSLGESAPGGPGPVPPGWASWIRLHYGR